MKKMGIRARGLLITSTVVRDSLEKIVKALRDKVWMVVGNIASQLWAYTMAGNCIYCRPTDNLNIVGIGIDHDLEMLFGAVAEGFIGDQVRRLNFLVSHSPKFRIDAESYARKRYYMSEFDRRVFLNIWNIEIPVTSLEDHIIAKLSMGRKKDFLDVRNVFLAYKRYLRSSVIMNTHPRYIIRLSLLKEILDSEYSEIAEDVILAIENITGSSFIKLREAENRPRVMIELLKL